MVRAGITPPNVRVSAAGICSSIAAWGGSGENVAQSRLLMSGSDNWQLCLTCRPVNNAACLVDVWTTADARSVRDAAAVRAAVLCCRQTDINDNPPDPARPISASQLAPRGKVRARQQQSSAAAHVQGTE
jgi:hypothetical protein